jgi:hypothetical protein
MTQLDLFILELTDAELARLNALIREICDECTLHDEFFEFEPGCFVEV